MRVMQADSLLVCYGKPLKPKNSSIYLCSRGHSIYRIFYLTANNNQFIHPVETQNFASPLVADVGPRLGVAAMSPVQ